MGKVSIARIILIGLGLVPVAANTQGYESGDSTWRMPNQGGTLPAVVEYPNATGRIRILNTDGPVRTEGHAFFTALGTNGRACVSCHQPADGMGLSVDSIRRQWQRYGAADPLFAAIDGSNCPSLRQQEAASHSLLLNKGLFRVFLPWPPRGADGSVIKAEFDIEVVKDPAGCNLDPEYGLYSRQPMISVYRRPRPVANIKYLTELPHGVPPHEAFFYNDKSLLPRDPETGQFVSLQLMSDGRGISLRNQARDAAATHLQVAQPLTEAQLQQIVAFERQVYAAQSYDHVGGDLTGPGAPPGLGPEALRDGAPARLGNNPVNRIFGSFAMWLAAANDPTLPVAQREFRASVARGAEIFYARRFLIADVGAYNDKGLGNPFNRSCGSGCHNTLLMGMDLAPGFMDLGLNNWPWANVQTDLPLFRVSCHPDAVPQSYLGRVIYTHDPGRALITGKCRDVGATMTQQSRALVARAPYFVNGSSADLREMVDFYDRRFNIGYTEQEKQDLVNFMRTL
ncbi:MAG: hypothetical protein EPO25_14315 [Gammaproteobacteria bacterium]|nr:MAG: hypothetical protein EPO25_14315 [Gammaproteobacteria bacterium]